MRDFLKSKPSDRQALWAKVKQEQADLIADARKEWRTSKSSGSKDSAEGDLRRTGDTSIATIWDRVRPIYAGAARGSTDVVRPPTPPPPTKTFALKPPKVAPRRPDADEKPWIERAGDSRRLSKVEVAGDRSNAPILTPNLASAAPFDDKTQDHHWEVLPGLNQGTDLQREMAICATGVGRYQGLQDSKGTICFLRYMEVYEDELVKRLGDNYHYDPDWRQRWWDIIQGSNLVRYKFCWTHAQYEVCARLWPFTKAWWKVVPTPMRVKITRGHAGPALDNDARGTVLPRGFAPSLRHFTHMKFVSDITKFGLKPGVVCKTSARNCVHFSIDTYDPIQYREAAKRLAEGDLTLPVRIGYPTRADYDCDLILNFDAVYESGAELMQEEAFAVTSKAYFTVPWQCIEAAVSRNSRILVWVNPEYYGKWLPRPQVNIYGTGASSFSSGPTPAISGEPTSERRVTSGTPWDTAFNELLWGKARSENCSMCPRCYRKEQLGTIACYQCGITMTSVPISSEQVQSMAADATTYLLQSLGLRVRAPSADADPRRARGVKRSVILGKSWELRVKGWRHGARKKK